LCSDIRRAGSANRTPISRGRVVGPQHERQAPRDRELIEDPHWFTSLAHAEAVMETWRREYNEERPKKGPGGLTPAAYAVQLTAGTNTAKVTAGF
jgi:hypothetical protein